MNKVIYKWYNPGLGTSKMSPFTTRALIWVNYKFVHCFEHASNCFVYHFPILLIRFIGESQQTKCFDHSSIFFSCFDLLIFLIHSQLSYFGFFGIILYHGQGNWSNLQKYSIKIIHSKTEETCFITFSFSYIICK